MSHVNISGEEWSRQRKQQVPWPQGTKVPVVLTEQPGAGKAGENTGDEVRGVLGARSCRAFEVILKTLVFIIRETGSH